MPSLKSLRPSTLVLLAAAPFLIYLFASSSKYTRSLKAIIGVGENAAAEFQGFLLILLVLASGFIAARAWQMGALCPGWLKKLSTAAAPLHVVFLLVILARPDLVAGFVQSVFYNALDPLTSDLIDRSVRPWVLKAEAKPVLADWTTYLTVAGLLLAAVVAGAQRFVGGKAGENLLLAYVVLSGGCLFYLMFVAHWGFAAGVAITFRAAIFAYILAAILGLVWTGLQTLRPGPRTYPVYATISAVLLAVSAFFFLQPQEDYILVGSTEARIAIIKGTPQRITDKIRFGEYEGAPSSSISIRSTPDVASGLKLVSDVKAVSGAFVPADTQIGNLPVLWKTTFLPNSARTPGLTFAVLGFLLTVLTFGGFQHRLHPLAVGSEFFVDTIRGIPMLVIILYIGLPLAGAVKNATGGGIDLDNMVRGIIAISVGYSAYMAEIFRSGIEAIPKGQIEAGRSLGLSRWQSARLIILPQALRIVIPPLGNEFIAMIKDTSLLSILSVRDLTQRMREFQADSFLPFAPFNTAAVLYVVITLGCASFLKWIERRYEQRRH